MRAPDKSAAVAHYTAMAAEAARNEAKRVADHAAALAHYSAMAAEAARADGGTP